MTIFRVLSRIVGGLGMLLLTGPVYAALVFTFISIDDTEPVTANKWTASLAGNVLTVTPVNGTLDSTEDRIINITLEVENTSASQATMGTVINGLNGISSNDDKGKAKHYDLWAGTAKINKNDDFNSNIFNHKQIFNTDPDSLSGDNVTIGANSTQTLTITYRLHKNTTYNVSSGTTLMFTGP